MSERSFFTRIDRRLARRESPMPLDALATVAADSGMVRTLVACWRWVERAVRDSAVYRWSMRRTHLAQRADVTSTIAVCSVALVVAMITHIALLLRQPYAFPGRSGFLLPMALLACAVGALALRTSIALAWRDRRARR